MRTLRVATGLSRRFLLETCPPIVRATRSRASGTRARATAPLEDIARAPFIVASAIIPLKVLSRRPPRAMVCAAESHSSRDTSRSPRSLRVCWRTPATTRLKPTKSTRTTRLQPPPPSAQGRARSVMLFMIASLAALGGFLFGYDLGLIAGALLYMGRSRSTWSVEEVIVGMARRRGVRDVRRRRADAGARQEEGHRVEQRFLPPRAVHHGRGRRRRDGLGRKVRGGNAMGASAVVVPAYVERWRRRSGAGPCGARAS